MTSVCYQMQVLKRGDFAHWSMMSVMAMLRQPAKMVALITLSAACMCCNLFSRSCMEIGR